MEQLQVTKGVVRAQAREFISDILGEVAVTSGFIAVTPGKCGFLTKNSLQHPPAVAKRSLELLNARGRLIL